MPGRKLQKQLSVFLPTKRPCKLASGSRVHELFRELLHEEGENRFASAMAGRYQPHLVVLQRLYCGFESFPGRIKQVHAADDGVELSLGQRIPLGCTRTCQGQVDRPLPTVQLCAG